MRKLAVPIVLCMTFLVAPHLHAQSVWTDDFDHYALAGLAAQSDWEEWYSKSGVDADVSNDHAFTGSQSVKILGVPYAPKGNDVVFPFRRLIGGMPNSGQWMCSVRTYVPGAFVGQADLTMLSLYDDGVPPSDSWSVWLNFRAKQNDLKSWGYGKESIPLVRDRWIMLRIFIDIDRDVCTVVYGDTILVNADSWMDGISFGGPPQIAAIALSGGSGNGSSGLYFDDAKLERVDAYSIFLDATPNPVPAGSVLELTTLAPKLTNKPAALFVWDVAGIPVLRMIATGSIQISGRWSVFGPVPTGLSGLDFDFRTFVVGPSGGVIEGPKELIRFQ